MFRKYIKNAKMREVAEWCAALVAACLLYILLQTFGFKTAKIEGSSMEPTMFHNDRVIVARFSYWFKEPQYNDIIAFPFPEDTNQVFIKRVIGLPGDVIDLVSCRFILNGEPLNDEFSEELISANGNVEFPLTVPEGCYFVLGDNRNLSKDSRYGEVGCIPKKQIIGKADLRIMPFSRIGFME